MTYPLVQSTDHADRSVTKLLDQFQDKAVLEAVLRAFLFQIQRLENATWEVLTLRTIETGEGIILDHLGKIVGRPRLGLGDPDYRIAIRAQIRINRSSGRPEDLIDVARLSIPDTFDFIYSEYYPAAIEIEILQEVTFNVQVLFSNLVRAKSGGVRLTLVYSTLGLEDTFTFSPDAASSTDTALGLGTLDDPGIGGQLVTLIDSNQ